MNATAIATATRLKNNKSSEAVSWNMTQPFVRVASVRAFVEHDMYPVDYERLINSEAFDIIKIGYDVINPFIAVGGVL